MTDSFKSKVLKSLGWSALDRWGSRVFSVVVLIVLARLLEPKSFGILAAALIFIEYLELFVSQGIGYAIVQRKNLDCQHLNAAFWMNVASGLILGLFLWFLSPFIASFFDMPELKMVLMSLSPLLFVAGISRIQVAILTRELRFKALAIRRLVGQFSGSVTGIAMAFYGYGVWSLVGQTTVSAVIGSAILWFASGWRPGISMSIRHLKDIYGYSVKILLDQQVIYFSGRIDEALIGYLLDSVSLGLYSIGKRLVMIFYDAFNATIGMIVFPLFSKIQEDRERLMNSLLMGSRFYLAFAIPAYLGLAFFSHEAITLVFGNQWSQAAGVTMLLALTGPFQFAPLFIHAAFQATGGPGIPLILNSIRALLSLILFPLGSFYGLTGIAAAFMARSITSPIADIIALKIKMKMKILLFAVQAGNPVCSALIAIMACKGFMELTIGMLDARTAFFIAIFMGGVLYISVLIMLDRSLIHDMKNVFSRRK